MSQVQPCAKVSMEDFSLSLLAASVLYDENAYPVRLSREDVEREYGSAINFFKHLGLRPTSREGIDAAIARSVEMKAAQRAGRNPNAQLGDGGVQDGMQSDNAQETKAGMPDDPATRRQEFFDSLAGNVTDPDQSFPPPEPYDISPGKHDLVPQGGLYAASERRRAMRQKTRLRKWAKVGLSLLVCFAILLCVWHKYRGGDVSALTKTHHPWLPALDMSRRWREFVQNDV